MAGTPQGWFEEQAITFSWESRILVWYTTSEIVNIPITKPFLAQFPKIWLFYF